MQIFDEQACRSWWHQNQEVALNGKPLWPPSGRSRVCIYSPVIESKLYYFSKLLTDLMFLNPTCSFLWVENHFIWPSSENLHLYYRVRASYNENRLIEEAPGHYLMDHEKDDLITFLHIGIMFGWEMFLGIPNHGNSMKISHDEYVEIASEDYNYIERTYRKAIDLELKANIYRAG